MLRFFNTMKRQKQEFIPLTAGEVKMYTCGPTVYNYAHIGNFRCYVFEDILRRYLKYKGYKVFQVMNITDVEDKIIRDARAQGVSIQKFTQQYEKAFFEDLDTLRIERVEVYPRATETIPEMVDLIKKLIEKGHTYQKEGSIYFRLSTFPDYGKLSGIRIDEVKIGARVDSDEYEKEDARDFVLWKAYKEGEAFWETELGKGRPGWHIECSAMSMKYLGERLDIHCGGEDNIFPHHENEIAQSEAATGKPFVNYWMHCRHLIVNGEKMSKSKGNFFTLRDLLNQGHNARAIRYMLVTAHYRAPLNLTQEGLQASAAAVERLENCYQRVSEIAQLDGEEPSQKIETILNQTRNTFEEYMDDDLDTPQAMANIFDLVREVNSAIQENSLTSRTAKRIKDFFEQIDTVLGFICPEVELLEAEIEDLIKERQEARKTRNFARADEIRDQLLAQGIILEDTPSGVRWRRKV